jgi:mono/diheme cytochrome c family protein
MTLHEFSGVLYATPISTGIRETTGLVPAVPSTRILAIAVVALTLGGCALQPTRIPAQSATATHAAPSAGGKIYQKWCGDCHSTPTGPGSQALERKYHGAVPAILEQRRNLPPEFVKLVVRRGVSFMPSFRKTEISDAELALVAAYLAASP